MGRETSPVPVLDLSKLILGGGEGGGGGRGEGGRGPSLPRVGSGSGNGRGEKYTQRVRAVSEWSDQELLSLVAGNVSSSSSSSKSSRTTSPVALFTPHTQGDLTAQAYEEALVRESLLTVAVTRTSEPAHAQACCVVTERNAEKVSVPVCARHVCAILKRCVCVGGGGVGGWVGGWVGG
jgi:hypothetical protein